MIVPFILMVLFGCCIGHKQDTNKKLKEKIISYIQTAAWKPIHWQADLDGSLILKVLQIYRIPIKTRLNGTGIPGNNHPESCQAIKAAKQGSKLSDGVYTIYPDGKTKKQAYCDMSTNGGGWTVFQRRYDSKVDFYRNWQEYKNGFGDPSGEYWLGNEAIHQLTEGGKCTMRIDAVTAGNDIGYAEYTKFTVGSENESYRMDFDKTSGTADQGSTMSYHKGGRFSTKDNDNDEYPTSCAQAVQGGWWHRACYNVDPNGKKMSWYYWKSTKSAGPLVLKKFKMMIRC